MSDEEEIVGPWDEEALRSFVVGGKTLGELEGITKEQQYGIADEGFKLLETGKYSEAWKVFEGLTALDPYDAYFHMALGSIAQRQENFDEAEWRYTRSLELNPFSPPALTNRGEIRLNQGKYWEARQDLEKAIEIDEEGKDPSTGRAKALLNGMDTEGLGQEPPAGAEGEGDADAEAGGEAEAEG